VAGITATGLIAFVIWVLLISDGSMTWRVGALGESSTHDELVKLGLRWTGLNNINAPAANGTTKEVDHVAVDRGAWWSCRPSCGPGGPA